MNDLKSQNKTSFNVRFVPVTGYRSAYMHHDKKHREEKLSYVHKDRIGMNEIWHREYQANGHPKTLKNYLNDTKKVVKEKTKRSMQKKAEDKVIGEAVVVVDEHTTMEDLQELGKRMEEKFGWTCVQIHLHKDEGYLGKRRDDMKHREGKYNLHAHMFFITTDLKTGKSWKRKKEDGSEMQNITAKTLRMERGIKKSERKVPETPNVVAFKFGEIARTEKELNAKKESLEREVGNLESSKNVAETSLNRVRADLNNANSELTRVSNELAGMENTNAALEREKSSLEGSISALTSNQISLMNTNETLRLEQDSLSEDLKREKEAFMNECLDVIEDGNKLLSKYMTGMFERYEPKYFEDLRADNGLRSETLDLMLELAGEETRIRIRAFMEAVSYRVDKERLQFLLREKYMDVYEGYSFIQPDGFSVKMDRPCTINISTNGDLIVEDNPGSGRYVRLKDYLNRIINSVKQKIEDIKQDYKEETEKIKQNVKKKFKIGW